MAIFCVLCRTTVLYKHVAILCNYTCTVTLYIVTLYMDIYIAVYKLQQLLGQLTEDLQLNGILLVAMRVLQHVQMW